MTPTNRSLASRFLAGLRSGCSSLFWFSIACLLFTLAPEGFAQTVAVSSTLTDGSGSAVAGKLYLHFVLFNCGANIPINSSTSAIVKRSFDIVANSSGLASGTVVPNDLIKCGNVANTTNWTVSVMSSANSPITEAQNYFICSGAATGVTCAQPSAGATFNIATAQPSSLSPPAPGFVPFLDNPVANQTVIQPGGTQANFQGTYNFCSATVLCGGSGGGVSATKHLYVDGTRTDSYTQTGSITTPFKTITGAVNQIAANGDGATYCYLIDAQPFVYVENVDTGNAGIYCLLLDGHGRAGTIKASSGSFLPVGATISPLSGNSFQSLSNNNQYTSIQVTGFNFTNAVNVTNATANNTMGMVSFVDDAFNGGLTLQGVGSAQILLSSFGFGQNFSVTNSNVNFIDSDMNTGSATLTWNSGLSFPSGFTSSALELVSWGFNPNSFTIGASTLVVAQNIALGAPSHLITVNGTLTLADSSIAEGNITVNSGGVLNVWSPSGVLGTLTLNAGSTYTPSGTLYANQINLGPGLCQILTASGSPNGVVAAPVCSVYVQTNGTSGNTLWVKDSGGSTSSGWDAVPASGGSALPASPQLGDTVRYNVNGDTAWDLANFAPLYQTIGWAAGTLSASGATTSAPTALGTGTSVFPSTTAGWGGTYTSSSSASTSTVVGTKCCENGNNSAFGILAFYRFSMRLAIGNTTNARYWLGLGNWNTGSGTGNNNVVILNTAAYASDSPNKTTLGFRFSGTTDTHWQAVALTANNSGGAQTTVDTGITPDTNPHLFEMTTNRTGTSIQYFIDSALVATITTNLPNPSSTFDSLAEPFWCGDNKNTATAIAGTFYWMELSLK